jgi:hypothetical protein
MRKSVYLSAATAALLLAGAALSGLPGREAVAQAGGVYVNAVDLDIKPGDMAKFIEAVKENGAAAVKEPGWPRTRTTSSSTKSMTTKPR